MSRRLHIVACALGLALAALGCGGSDAAPDSDEASKASNSGEPPVPRPVYPRCGAETFAAPAVSRGPGGGWRLLYSFPRAAPSPPSPGQTTLVNLEERPPKSARVPYANARTIRVRGREVDIYRQKGAFVAQWVTKRARYVAIANGKTTAVLRKIIACTP